VPLGLALTHETADGSVEQANGTDGHQQTHDQGAGCAELLCVGGGNEARQGEQQYHSDKQLNY